MNTYTRRPPRTLDEARTRRLDLVAEVKSIEAQLGSKTRKDQLYTDPKQYYTWKNNAKLAMNARVDELRYLNKWIQERVMSTVTPALKILIHDADGRDVIALRIADGYLEARFEGVDNSWIEVAEMDSNNLLDFLECKK